MSELLFKIKKELENGRKKASFLEKEIRDQKRINEALKYVTSVVLHELKTPLNSTSEYVLKLRDLLVDGGSNDSIETILDVIERNIRQMNYVMAHLDPAFDISSNVIVEVNLYKLVNDIYEELRVLNKNEIRMVNSVPEELRTIFSDRNKLKEIITNLVENSIKYIENGDRIEVSARDDKELVVITVKDNGPGIPDEIVQSIFKGDYEKIIKATRKNGSGGLGLAVVERLVREHGGQINLKNSDEGTEIEITIPFNLIDSSLDDDIVEDSESSIVDEEKIDTKAINDNLIEDGRTSEKKINKKIDGKAKILLIDDDKDLISYIASGFPKSEFMVTKVNDGSKGIAYAAENLPDLIILDVLMIGMNGFEVLSYLKGNSKTREIPVIMLSNVRGESKALKMGAKAYLQKPVTHEVLLSNVRTILNI